MSSQFESNLEMLIAHSVSEAHVRLKNCDEEYNEDSARMSDIREEMENLFEDNKLTPQDSHFEMVKEYFELDQDTYSLEHEATYFQGVYDCIKVLTKLGWINK